MILSVVVTDLKEHRGVSEMRVDKLACDCNRLHFGLVVVNAMRHMITDHQEHIRLAESVAEVL